MNGPNSILRGAKFRYHFLHDPWFSLLTFNILPQLSRRIYLWPSQTMLMRHGLHLELAKSVTPNLRISFSLSPRISTIHKPLPSQKILTQGRKQTRAQRIQIPTRDFIDISYECRSWPAAPRYAFFGRRGAFCAKLRHQ